LRDAKPRSIEHPTFCFIAQTAKVLEKFAAVIVKARTSKSGDVFQLDHCRLRFCNQAKRLGEQIALVFMAELLPGD
jgi:hypothetical protein